MMWLFKKRPSDDEVREELEAHVAMRAAHDGVDEAAARRRLGNVLQTREAVRRVWIARWWDELRQDAWFTWRSCRRHPGFALAAVLVLALGLGSSTAMFSALDRMLFRPLPYGEADRLVHVGRTFPEPERPDHSQILIHSSEYRERWKPAPAPFTAVTSTADVGKTCDITEQRPERLRCAGVESNFLRTLGVPVALGRDFTPDDDVRNAARVAIISHEIWTRRFGADPGAVGRIINLDGTRTRVIGVLPAGFAVPGGQSDILRPQQALDGFDGALLAAFARLRPGVTPEQAEAAIAPIVEERDSGSLVVRPGRPGQTQARVVRLRDYLVGDTSRAAWLLLGAVAGLLLVACVNVANLILARMAVRDREFAVRSALGAGHTRLARLVLTEGVLLAVAGGGIGLLSATVMLRVFARLAPSSIPEIDQASLDLRVLAVTAVLAMVAGLAVGIWPALSVLRGRALQHGARAIVAAHPQMRFTLVAVQIALTVTLITGSALLLRTLWNLVAVPLGYQSQRVVTMNVTLNVARYPPRASGPFFERLLERIRTIPGTAGATMSSAAPPSGVALAGFNFPVDHQEQALREVSPGLFAAVPLASPLRVREVTPGYFQTFGIPILQGRGFTEADRTARPAVIVSESAARILFAGRDPIGHTVQVPPANEWAEVVGVAREIRNTGLTEEPAPELYTLWRRNGSSVTSFSNMAFFAIRTQGRTADAVAFLKQAVADLDPQLPVTVRLLDDQVAELTERPRFLAWLLSAFAGLALLLAAAGLYGVASYLVTQRTRELGLRIALGAAPGDMARQVIGEAGRWIAAGAAGGALLSWGATRAIRSQLFQVAAVDPVSWAAAFVVLGVALLAAVARPAVRAARVDPIAALQAD